MTDRELCEFGEKLYASVLYTPLSAATLFNLGLAVRQAIPWSALPQHLRFAVFKIAAGCLEQEDGEDASAKQTQQREVAANSSPTLGHKQRQPAVVSSPQDVDDMPRMSGSDDSESGDAPADDLRLETKASMPAA